MAFTLTVKRRALEAYLRVAGSPNGAWFNRKLVSLGLHGLGVRNWRNLEVSGEQLFLRRLLAGVDSPVVLDVGAHEGGYARAVLRAAPSATVYCVEPHAGTFERLRSVADELGFLAINAACGATDGRAILYDYADRPEGTSHASMIEAVIPDDQTGCRTMQNVEVVTVDSICRERELDRVTLLKVDAEGSELDVLRGATRAIRDCAVQAIQFEFNEMHVAAGVFLRDFAQLLPCFSFYRVLPRGLLPLGDYRPLQWEVFAFQNIVAIASEAEWASRRVVR